jgi:hypothetical protein
VSCGNGFALYDIIGFGVSSVIKRLELATTSVMAQNSFVIWSSAEPPDFAQS